MPFRKKSRLLHKDATPDEVARITELLAERMQAVLGILTLLAVFLVVITITLEIQTQKRNNYLDKQLEATNHLAQQTNEVQKEVGDLRLVVDNIIEKAQPAINNSIETQQSRQRIAAIENKLCGGPCPKPPPTTTP